MCFQLAGFRQRISAERAPADSARTEARAGDLIRFSYLIAMHSRLLRNGEVAGSGATR